MLELMWAASTKAAICWGQGRLVVLNGSFLWSADRTWDVPPTVIWQGLASGVLKVRPLNVTDNGLNKWQSSRRPASNAATFMYVFVVPFIKKRPLAANLRRIQTRGLLCQDKFECVLHRVKTERDRCACAEFTLGEEGGQCGRSRGRGDVQPEPIAGVTFTDWPPFTGCWHGCYIKDMPPTAAPDNLKHWHRWEGGKRHSGPPQLLFGSLAGGTFY